ncbi:hypothetical protein GCM10007904_08510 [Oharaeibacter diazotrophicus]|nr:hypothetical protein GCM10007904_08510 [Oharaeibacter diazotrophicus]
MGSWLHIDAAGLAGVGGAGKRPPTVTPLDFRERARDEARSAVVPPDATAIPAERDVFGGVAARRGL